jgi:hypothetical protein
MALSESWGGGGEGYDAAADMNDAGQKAAADMNDAGEAAQKIPGLIAQLIQGYMKTPSQSVTMGSAGSTVDVVEGQEYSDKFASTKSIVEKPEIQAQDQKLAKMGGPGGPPGTLGPPPKQPPPPLTSLG